MTDAPPQKIRAFFAVLLPPQVRGQLEEVQKELRRRASFAPVRWIAPEQCHITLKFLGYVPAILLPALIEDAQQRCRGISPFKLELGDELGFFPSPRRAQIVWVGVATQTRELELVQEALEQSAEKHGIEKETRPFHAHITIGRLSAGKNLERERTPRGLRKPAEWPVEQIALQQSKLSSQGASYHTIAVLPLPGGL